MLIGQAPGWREIETGMPFAWDAGKRLSGWLSAAGIGVDDFRERWYVTSVAKCYPGRAPGILGRPPAIACRDRSMDDRPFSRRCASSRRGWSCSSAAPRIGSPSGLTRVSTTSSAASLTWDAAPGASVLALPHPSGASTWLNDPSRVELWRAGIGLLRERWADLGA